MYTWHTTSAPPATTTNTTRVTISPRAVALTLAAALAALVLTVGSAMAATHESHGWTYDTASGVVTASADAWHKPSAEGDLTITLWRRDTHDGPQTRVARTVIPSQVPVSVTLGVLPSDACGGQWDVRAADGTWLAGQQWQVPGCGATSSTTTEPTTTTTSSSSTEPTWTTSTTTPATTTTSTTASGTTSPTSSTSATSSVTVTATTTTGGGGSTRPPSTSGRHTGGPSLPDTGPDLPVGLSLLLVAVGVAAVAATRRTGRYRR